MNLVLNFYSLKTENYNLVRDRKVKTIKRLIVVPNVNICTYFITTEGTESTEELCPDFLYSVFSVLSVVNPSLEIGEEILILDYK